MVERCSLFLRGPRFPKELLAMETRPAIIDLAEIMACSQGCPLVVPLDGLLKISMSRNH